MAGLQVLHTTDNDQWMELLTRSCQYDFYHLPNYHALAERQGEGTARLFVYTEGQYSIALPLLLRTVQDTPGLEQVGADWKDAASVYGYAGPIASRLDL